MLTPGQDELHGRSRMVSRATHENRNSHDSGHIQRLLNLDHTHDREGPKSLSFLESGM
jgi:hypothetical protein